MRRDERLGVLMSHSLERRDYSQYHEPEGEVWLAVVLENVLWVHRRNRADRMGMVQSWTESRRGGRFLTAARFC